MKTDWIFYCSCAVVAALFVLCCLVFGLAFLSLYVDNDDYLYAAIFWSLVALPLLTISLMRVWLGREKISLRRMSEIVFILGGFDFLFILCFLEWNQVLLVMQYWFVTPLCVLLMIAFLATGISWLRNGRIRFGWSSILAAVLLISFGLSVGYIPTSRNKQFFIIARQIKPGGSIDSAKAKLRGYNSVSVPYTSTHPYTGLRFSTEPDGSVSAYLWVRYDPATGRILAVDYDTD